ncbi:hypothetical protein ACXXDK_14980 (plasmid) [Deinococcus sp. PESE-38]
MESPLTNRPKATSGIDLRATPAAVAALRPFTALSTENNHAGDGGKLAAGKTNRCCAAPASCRCPGR